MSFYDLLSTPLPNLLDRVFREVQQALQPDKIVAEDHEEALPLIYNRALQKLPDIGVLAI